MMTLFNPFHKSRCPHCGETFYPGNCAIVSDSKKSGPLKDANPSFLARMWVPPMQGPKFTSTLAARQCPYCWKLLPRNIERAESHTIAIVGDVASGKSHYIASCIDQLKKGRAWQMIGCMRVAGQGNTDVEYFKEYYDPIYNRLEQKEGTQNAPPAKPGSIFTREPLIYEVVFRKKSALKYAKTINLLFYDSSGEDLTQVNRMVLYSNYVLNASAIIFLFDPLAMPGIVDKLPQHLKPKLGGPPRQKASDILNRVIQTFEQNQRLEAGTPLKTPIAVTISKSDLLKFVMKYMTPPPLFLNDTVFGNSLDSYQFDRINNEVQELLQRLGDQELLPSVSSFQNKCFFAVSATGFPSDGAGTFPAIEPLRCLDPLLWTLWKLQLVDNE